MDAPANGRWRALDTVALASLTVVGGVLRLVRLGTPAELVFDEVYYAKDSCWYALGRLQACRLDTMPTEVHPPLGKWLMGAGIKLFGFDAFGWRVVAAIVGTITIVLLYLLARRLLRSTLAATLSSGLLVFSFLHFVQSRTSMLDIFVPLFGIAAFLFVVYDRDGLLQRAAAGQTDDAPLLMRPWRLAAGVAGGAALASKWSGGLILVAVVVLTLAWEFGVRRRDGGGALMRRWRRELASVALLLVVVPALVYSATYIGRIEGSVLATPWSEDSWFDNYWDHQTYMYGFHAHLDANHSYQSAPWSWPVLKRPVSYFFCSGDDCTPAAPGDDYKEILATGNPFVWWASLIGMVAVAVSWVRHRDPGRPEGLILLGFAVTYLPWLVLATDRSAVFLFYMLPVLPFMFLALGWVTTKIGSTWEARAAVGLFAAGAIGLFAFYYPLLAATPITRDAWEERIWIFDNCDEPPEATITTTETVTRGGETFTETKETKSEETLPPTGWCWI